MTPTEPARENGMSQKGWECPRCGSVYAPWMAKCSGCVGARKPPAGATAITCGCPTYHPGGTAHILGCRWSHLQASDNVSRSEDPK